MDSQVNKLASNLHNRINAINKIKPFTNFKSRLSFLNAYVIGKLNYMLPHYNKLPNHLNNKLHKILMTAARCAVGSYCFKKSNKYILDKCKWLPLEKMITLSSLNFIYNIEKYKKPKGVLTIFRNSNYNR